MAIVSPIAAGAFDDVDAGGGESLHLVGRGALASGDDRSGVAHATARRRGLPGDEADDRLLHVLLDVRGGGLFGGAADFADEDDRLGLGIFVEQLERVDMRGADDRVAADADRRRLADAALRELIDRLIGQRAGARDDADVPSLWMRPGMMPILALPGEMTPGQLGPMRRDLECLSTLQTRTMSIIGMPSVMQTISGRPASSASRMASAANGGGTKITVALAPVFATASSHGVEDRPAFVDGAAFAGRDTADDLGAVFGAALRVKGAFFAGNALDDEAGVFAYKTAMSSVPSS